MPINTIHCAQCGSKREAITPMIASGETVVCSKVGLKACRCGCTRFIKKGIGLTADMRYQWKRSVEPIWLDGKDPGTRIA